MDDLLDALERDPSRRRLMWALGAVAATACAVGAIGQARHHAQLRAECAQGASIVATTWNSTVEGRVRRALDRAGGPSSPDVAERVVHKLGDYARTWGATYDAVKDATLLRGEQTTTIMDRRLRCLERGREQLQALAEVLSKADAAVTQSALDAAYALPEPASCATSDVATMPALPSSPELRARVLAAERAVSQAAALGYAGEDRQAIELVEKTLPEVRAIPHKRIEAELLLLECTAARKSGDSKVALSSCQQAMLAGARAGDDGLVARAAAGAAYTVSVWLDKPREGEFWTELANSIAERMGHEDALEVDVLHSRIVTSSLLGQADKAVELQDRQIAVIEHLYGDRDPRMATAVMNRGVERILLLNQADAALADFQRAIELLSSLSGPDNPHLSIMYSNAGQALLELGRPQEGKVAYERARALRRDWPKGSLAVVISSGLARAENELDRPAEAVRRATEGLEIAASVGDTSTNMLSLLMERSKARAKMGDIAGQAEDCARVLAIQTANGPVVSGPAGPDPLRCLGEAELARHRLDSALSYLEQSVALDRGFGVEVPYDRAMAQFALARALRAAGREPARADELARLALDGLRTLRGRDRDIAAVERWIHAGRGTAD
jgi:tetratricopeptide (TPR) repeat protein